MLTRRPPLLAALLLPLTPSAAWSGNAAGLEEDVAPLLAGHCRGLDRGLSVLLAEEPEPRAALEAATRRAEGLLGDDLHVRFWFESLRQCLGRGEPEDWHRGYSAYARDRVAADERPRLHRQARRRIAALDRFLSAEGGRDAASFVQAAAGPTLTISSGGGAGLAVRVCEEDDVEFSANQACAPAASPAGSPFDADVPASIVPSLDVAGAAPLTPWLHLRGGLRLDLLLHDGAPRRFDALPSAQATVGITLLPQVLDFRRGRPVSTRVEVGVLLRVDTLPLLAGNAKWAALRASSQYLLDAGAYMVPTLGGVVALEREATIGLGTILGWRIELAAAGPLPGEGQPGELRVRQGEPAEISYTDPTTGLSVARSETVQVLGPVEPGVTIAGGLSFEILRAGRRSRVAAGIRLGARVERASLVFGGDSPRDWCWLDGAIGRPGGSTGCAEAEDIDLRRVYDTTRFRGAIVAEFVLRFRAPAQVQGQSPSGAAGRTASGGAARRWASSRAQAARMAGASAMGWSATPPSPSLTAR